MKLSKERLVELSNKTNFIKDNLEKVIRLSEILKFLNEDSKLKGKLALKGGTAINLTAVSLPRLSVDIDLDYVDNLSKEEIEKEKEVISKIIKSYMLQEGYSLNPNSRSHYALLSFTFSYINNANNKDSIKIEINFIDRCHILSLENKTILPNEIIEEFNVLTLNTTELYASKINALISRAAPRDLYDINKMIDNSIIEDKDLLRKCLIFYNMVGGNQNIQDLDFTKVRDINFMKFKTQLRPVISKTDNFKLEDAKDNVINFINKSIKLNKEEVEFIKEFKNKNYKPELLFNDENIIRNIINHPMAIWRCKKD